MSSVPGVTAGLPARVEPVGNAWTESSCLVETIPDRSWDRSLRTSSWGSMVVRAGTGRRQDCHHAAAFLFVTHAHQMIFNVDTALKRLLRPRPDAPPRRRNKGPPGSSKELEAPNEVDPGPQPVARGDEVRRGR